MTQVQLPGASINLALRQVKMGVWWSTGQVKLQCQYSQLLWIISIQKQFQNLTLQDEKNNESEA